MYDTGREHEDVLFVTPKAGDARRFREVVEDLRGEVTLHDVADAAEALAFLEQRDQYADAPRPDLVVFDLQASEEDDFEFLSTLKSDAELKQVPVVVLTELDTSDVILRLYELPANACIRRPDDPDEFEDVVESLASFWLSIAQLPPKQ